MRRFIFMTILVLISYFLMAFIFFDFSQSADFGDAGYCQDNEISIGPDIRLLGAIVCPPGDYSFPAGGRYTGHEWIYRIYEPLFKTWRGYNGYIAPWEC